MSSLRSRLDRLTVRADRRQPAAQVNAGAREVLRDRLDRIAKQQAAAGVRLDVDADEVRAQIFALVRGDRR